MDAHKRGHTKYLLSILSTEKNYAFLSAFIMLSKRPPPVRSSAREKKTRVQLHYSEEEDEEDFQSSKAKKRPVVIDDNEDDDNFSDDHTEKKSRIVLKTVANKSFQIGKFTPFNRPKSNYDAKSALSKKFKVPTMSIKPPIDNETTTKKKSAALTAAASAIKEASEADNNFGERKTLGIRRRAGNMRALYDHTAEDAIVLWDPDRDHVEPEEIKISTDKPKPKGKSLSEILGLKKQEKKLVHVVVDPVLTRVLRPHQVEGVKFLYQCTTGQVYPEAMG